MTRARTVANFGAVTSDATELNLLDGETDLATQTELNDKLAISTATSTYAPLASPIFTGAPVTPILKLTPTAIAPAGVAGAIYYDSDEETLMQHDGTAWARIYTPPPEGSGGTETNYSGYKVHTFTADADFTISGGSLVLDILIVAGGGSGGGSQQGHVAGGGGAGGVCNFFGTPGNGGSGIVIIRYDSSQ